MFKTSMLGSTAFALATLVISTGTLAQAQEKLSGIATGTLSETAALVEEAAAAHFDNHKLMSLLVELRVDGAVISSVVMGEAMPGVPLMRDGRFRNGGVAMMYISATLLRLAEEGIIGLDDPISKWAPELPRADITTPRMLARMTGAYPDHVADSQFIADFVADPFRSYTHDEIIAYSERTPNPFTPGENWDYTHAGYFALGEVMARAGGKPLDQLIAQYVLEPLQLTGTSNSFTASIPEPTIHAFSFDRGIWEDATYWHPSWTLPPGSVETTTISDVAASFEATIGQGTLLAPASRDAMISPFEMGFGAPLEGCRSCHQLQPRFNYGFGVYLQDDWVYQTPLFGGYFSTVATLPKERNGGHSVTIAVAATATQATYDDWTLTLPNWSNQLATELGALLVPDNPPPPFSAPTL